METRLNIPSSTGDLLRILNVSNQDISFRLQIAQLLLDSPAHIIPRKPHFLLDWVINILLKTSARQNNPETSYKEGVSVIFLEPSIWDFLISLLKKQEIRESTSIQPKLIHVIENTFQHIHYRVSIGQSPDSFSLLAQKVENVLELIVSGFLAFLRPRFDHLCQYLCSISSLAIKSLNDHILASKSSSKASKFADLPQHVISLFGVLLLSLRIFKYLELEIGTPNKSFLLMVDELLLVLLNLRFLILKLFSSSAIDSQSQMNIKQSDIMDKMSQIVSLIEKNIQNCLFSPIHLDEFLSAFVSTISYQQDPFTVSSKKNASQSNVDDVEMMEPQSKRAKQGKKDDLKPHKINGVQSASQPDNYAKSSLSYVKSLFDKLKSLSSGSGDSKSVSSFDLPSSSLIALESIPLLFHLSLQTIFPSSVSMSAASLLSGQNSIFAVQQIYSTSDQNTSSNNSRLNIDVSEKHSKIFWALFCAFQRILLLQLDTNSKQALPQHADTAILSNSQLLKLILDYNIFGTSGSVHSVEKQKYMENHASHLVQLAKRFPDHDSLFGSLNILLDIDHTIEDQYIPDLLSIIWKSAETSANTTTLKDLWSANLIQVYALLRQLDVLISRILEYMHTTEIISFFDKQFWKALQAAVEGMPSGLIVPVFQIFIDDLRLYITQIHSNSTFGMAPLSSSNKSPSLLYQDNVRWVSSLFNHFLENLKLSPVLATQLCQDLDKHIVELTKPLLDQFMDILDGYDHVKAIEKALKSEKRSTKILAHFKDGLPITAQTGLSIYHIFITFQIYCQNRFFPSHNTAEDVSLVDEIQNYFGKIESKVSLGKFAHLLLLVSNHQTNTSDTPSKRTKVSRKEFLSPSFRLTLLKSVMQRISQLCKTIDGIPPANLPSLVRRSNQVEELKKNCLEELKDLLQFVENELDEFILKYESIGDQPVLNVNYSLQANDYPTYWAFFWDSTCNHIGMLTQHASTESLASTILKLIVSFSSSNKQFKTNIEVFDDHKTHISGSKTLIESLKASSEKVLLNANFYELIGVRRHLLPVLLHESSLQLNQIIKSYQKSIKSQSKKNGNGNGNNDSDDSDDRSKKVWEEIQSALKKDSTQINKKTIKNLLEQTGQSSISSNNNDNNDNITHNKKSSFKQTISSQQNIISSDWIDSKSYSNMISLLKHLVAIPQSFWSKNDVQLALHSLLISLISTLHLIEATHSKQIVQICIGLLCSFKISLLQAIKLEEPFFDIFTYKQLFALLERSSSSNLFKYDSVWYSSILKPFVYQLVMIGSPEATETALKICQKLSKRISKLKKNVTSDDSSYKVTPVIFELQAIVEGFSEAYESIDEACFLQEDWIKQNQRHQLGWKPPQQKKLKFDPEIISCIEDLQSLNNDLLEIVEKSTRKSKSTSIEIGEKSTPINHLILMSVFYSFVNINRLRNSKYAYCPSSSKPVMTSELRISSLLSLSFNHLVLHSNTASQDSMDIDHPQTQKESQDTIQFDYVSAILKCFVFVVKSYSSTHLSDNDVSGIISILFCLIQRNNEEHLLHSKPVLNQDELVSDSNDLFCQLSTANNSLPSVLNIFKDLVSNLSSKHCNALMSFLTLEITNQVARLRTDLTNFAALQQISNDFASQNRDHPESLNPGHIRLATCIDLLYEVLTSMNQSTSYIVSSMYVSSILNSLILLVHSSVLPLLNDSLPSRIHSKIINIFTHLVKDKFVEMNGTELNAVLSSLNASISKFHAFSMSTLFLQGLDSQLRNDQQAVLTRYKVFMDMPFDHWKIMKEAVFDQKLFKAHYLLLSACIHSRTSQTIKNISSFIVAIKYLLHHVVIRGWKLANRRIQADYIARLYTDLANLGTSMKPFSPLIIIDYVNLLEKESVAHEIQNSVNQGIFALVALLEENEQNMILKALDATGKDIFRNLVSEYQRDFRYQGKS